MPTLKGVMEELTSLQESKKIIWTLGSGEALGQDVKFAGIVHPRGSNEYIKRDRWSVGDDIGEVVQSMLEAYYERYGTPS